MSQDEMKMYTSKTHCVFETCEETTLTAALLWTTLQQFH